MPIYGWGGYNGRNDRDVKHAIDANGLEIRDRVVELNTDTGDAIIQKLDENMNLEIDYIYFNVAYCTQKYPAPILLIWE